MTAQTANITIQNALENLLYACPFTPFGDLIPILPILPIADPVFFTSHLIFAFGEPTRHIFLPFRFSFPPCRSLLFLHPVLLRCRNIILTIFHSPLIGAETSICRREQWPQPVRQRLERDDEGRQVERYARWTLMSLPDQESLRRSCFVPCLARRLQLRVFEAWSQASVDLVVPAPADTPSSLPIPPNHLPRDLVSRRCLPSTSLEVQRANLTSRPVLDLHRSIIVHCRRASDDADDGARHFLPRVELFASRRWAKLQEPCTKRIDVERFAVEFGLHRGFALTDKLAMDSCGPERRTHIVIPFRCLCPCRPNWRMMADLFNQEAIALVWSDVFVRFTEQRVEWFSHSANGRSVLARREGSNINHALSRIHSIRGSIEQISVLHVFRNTLQ